ncbi:MAG: OmpA family protein [Actinobacteria bacterium]|nr:OmpA family protein [Actinomycetota bacterium]
MIRPRSSVLVAVALVLVGSVASMSAPIAARDASPNGRRVVGITRRTVEIVRRVGSISGDILTEQRPEQVAVTLAADVLFAFDRADLSPAANTRLSEVARQIKALAKGPVAIVGYTDSVGTVAYNADLSLRRATSVRDALAGQLPGVTFNVSGRGEADPVAPNANPDGSDNPDGRARNRRVTITFRRAR